MAPDQTTIFALASGAMRAGISVLRVSGPASATALRTLTQGDLPTPRKAVYRIFQSPSGEVIDKGLALWFPAPASFTGEDVVEFHLHGGAAVIREMITTLESISGLVPAAPGEFSRRAFENGKMDLTQAEGLADLINAETVAQRRQALRQMDGALGKLYEEWRQRLIGILAVTEADIDFPDEDLPDGMGESARDGIATLITEIESHLADEGGGERVREGIRLAIVGAPNVGKSSLLNRLAKREAAIVTPIAGTTRDVIEIHLDIGGYPVIAADTAGLRDSTDLVEREGVNRARDRAESADLVLALFDGTEWPTRHPETLSLIDDSAIPIVTKGDLADVPEKAHIADLPICAISVKTGKGLDALMQRMEAEIKDRWAPGGNAVLTRARHRWGLETAVADLRRAQATGELELAAEDLRLAARSLGSITGRVDVEDILDALFAEFCIGK
ncbi:MAG: tRNA uridine-5-carboxymethylaminomethyl(34) synthesis GTPase MnmE [Magnetospiraceae bacterium]